MNGIESFVAEAPTAELLLIVLGSSLVLSVLIGGIVYLRRTARPQPRPAAAPAEARLAEAVAAYHARTAPAAATPAEDDEDVRAWEAELAERIDELEAAFSQLAGRLGRVTALDGDAREVLEVLTRRRTRAAGEAPSSDAPEAMSEEQRRLLERLRTRAATGATGA